MLDLLVGSSQRAVISRMKGTACVCQVSLTDLCRDITLSYAATVGAVSFLLIGFPMLRCCSQVFTYESLPATLFYFPELGIKQFEHCFHLTDDGYCLQPHHSLSIWQTHFGPWYPSFAFQVVPIFSCSLSKTHFFQNADSNMWPVNNQAGEELCLGS